MELCCFRPAFGSSSTTMEYCELGGDRTSLVLFAFLQNQECKNKELQRELETLGEKMRKKDANSNSCQYLEDCYAEEDGELQTDGHFCSDVREFARERQFDVQGIMPINAARDAELRNIAAGLIEIADQLEQRVVARASESLVMKLRKSSQQLWLNHLSSEVRQLMQTRLPGLQHFSQERVLLALTMTLVKRVCEQAPSFLHGLFCTAVDYINSRQPNFMFNMR